jgi:RNA polymerase sigma factor (sigma-70 family)
VTHKAIDRAVEEGLIRTVQAGVIGDPRGHFRLCPRASVAAGELVTMHRGLLLHWTIPYARVFAIELEDMMQVAAVGLIAAVVRFRFSERVRLATYAKHWVRHYVERHGQDTAGAVRVPVHMQQSKRLSYIRAKSLDVPVAGHEGRETYAERIPDEAPTPMQTGETEEIAHILRAAIHAAVARLDPRAKGIITRRLMQDEDDRATLAELGGEWGLSRERVRQIECMVKERLRRDGDVRLAAAAAGLL